MIRRLPSGKYRLYSQKKDPKTGKRRNLGTFGSRAAAEKQALQVHGALALAQHARRRILDQLEGTRRQHQRLEPAGRKAGELRMQHRAERGSVRHRHGHEPARDLLRALQEHTISPPSIKTETW